MDRGLPMLPCITVDGFLKVRLNPGFTEIIRHVHYLNGVISRPGVSAEVERGSRIMAAPGLRKRDERFHRHGFDYFHVGIRNLGTGRHRIFGDAI